MVLALVFEQLRISLVTEQSLRGHKHKLVNALHSRCSVTREIFFRSKTGASTPYKIKCPCHHPVFDSRSPIFGAKKIKIGLMGKCSGLHTWPVAYLQALASYDLATLSLTQATNVRESLVSKMGPKFFTIVLSPPDKNHTKK
jgi:hypothetical protein